MIVDNAKSPPRTEPAAPDPRRPRRLATWRLPPPLAALLAVAVLTVSALIGFANGADFGGVDDDPRADVSAAPLDVARLQPRPGSGDRLPRFALSLFGDGGTVEASDFRGSPLVLNFWASWCPFCIEEMPDLERVHRRFTGAVAFLGVDLQDDRGLASELIDRTGVTYPIAEDRGGSLFADAGGLGMPTTLLVTADGHVAKKLTGPVSADELEKLVLEHLVEETGP